MSTLLNAEFLKQCEGLHREAQRAWGRRFLGRRPRLRVAGGTEATGYHDYTTGDELRYVDWNRCARLDELVTRQFMGVEDHYVYLLVDCSRSMAFGDGRKLDFARRIAATLGYLAVANLDRVGACSFADRLTQQLPPARGPRSLPRLFDWLEQLRADPAATNLLAAVQQFVAGREHRGMTVIVSDLLDPAGFETSVDLLRHRGFEPFLLQVIDEEEARPKLAGKVALADMENPQVERRQLTAEDLRNYRAVFDEFLSRVRAYCHRYGLGISQVAADSSVPLSVERIVRGSRRRLHTRAGVR